jgi:hypothetical protein
LRRAASAVPAVPPRRTADGARLQVLEAHPPSSPYLSARIEEAAPAGEGSSTANRNPNHGLARAGGELGIGVVFLLALCGLGLGVPEFARGN